MKLQTLQNGAKETRHKASVYGILRTFTFKNRLVYSYRNGNNKCLTWRLIAKGHEEILCKYFISRFEDEF